MHVQLIQILFYVFSLIAVGSALMVISQNNPVRCVLFLVLTFFASAGLWMLAQAEFLSLILIFLINAALIFFLVLKVTSRPNREPAVFNIIYSGFNKFI